MAKSQQKRQKRTQKKAAKHKAKRSRQIKKLQNLRQKTRVESLVNDAIFTAQDGGVKKAEKTLSKLNKKYSNHPHVQFGLGALAVISKNLKEAIKYFDKAIELNPFFVEAYYNRAGACQESMNIKGSVEALGKVIELREHDSDFADLAEERLEELSNMIREVDGISLDEYIEGQEYFEKGHSLMHNKEFSKAIEYFERASSITPLAPQMYGNIGICYSYLGKKSLALEFLDKAIEIDPKYEPALANRMIFEKLEEGETPEFQIGNTNYYLDYPHKNKSLIQEMLDEQ